MSMTSCTKCPKATSIRSDRECSKTESTTSLISQSSSLVTQTTIGVTIPEDIKKMKKITTTTAMTESKKITESTIMSSMIETETEVQFTETTSTETEPVVYEYKTEPTYQTEFSSGYQNNTTNAFSSTYLGEWEGVWYTATDMNYNYQPYGASGNQLISGYSVACDNLPFGTRLLIECDYFTKEVRVDDCGVGYENILDFYYFDRSEIPSELLQQGRIPITVSVIN